jgi:membrane protein
MKDRLMVESSRLRDFLRTGVWRIRADELPPRRSFLLRQLRIILLALREFAEDRCQLRASALTFYSLLSVVPMVAMAFGVAKGFGFEKNLEKKLLEAFPDQPEVISRIIAFSRSLLENTQGGLIAGVGVAVLFWSVIKVLSTIENSFNDIWGIKKARAFQRKFSDYLSIMLVAPILLVMSSSTTIMITTQVHLITQKIAIVGAFAPILFAVLKVLPLGVMWLLFTFLYVFLPNTRVRVRSGLFGAVIAGTIYQIVQAIYIKFQVGVSNYGAIYGSFAALPLFLLWLQLSWLIVLFGAEISFAEQNVETYEFEPDCLTVSHAFKRLVALNITYLCVKGFQASRRPWTEDELSRHLQIPIRLVRQILFELVGSGILSEVKVDNGRSVAYQPARDIDGLTLQGVLSLLDQKGCDRIPIRGSRELEELSQRLKLLDKTIGEAPFNTPLKDL